MEGMSSTEPNPMSCYRWESLKFDSFDFQKLSISNSIDEMIDELALIEISKASPFLCSKCPAGYQTSSQLKRHITMKHVDNAMPSESKCDECEKVFSSMKSLTKHIKYVHRSCSICKIEFGSSLDKIDHMNLTHAKTTFCIECDKDSKFESKQKRHNQQKDLGIPPI